MTTARRGHLSLHGKSLPGDGQPPLAGLPFRRNTVLAAREVCKIALPNTLTLTLSIYTIYPIFTILPKIKSGRVEARTSSNAKTVAARRAGNGVAPDGVGPGRRGDSGAERVWKHPSGSERAKAWPVWLPGLGQSIRQPRPLAPTGRQEAGRRQEGGCAHPNNPRSGQGTVTGEVTIEPDQTGTAAQDGAGPARPPRRRGKPDGQAICPHCGRTGSHPAPVIIPIVIVVPTASQPGHVPLAGVPPTISVPVPATSSSVPLCVPLVLPSSVPGQVVLPAQQVGRARPFLRLSAGP